MAVIDELVTLLGLESDSSVDRESKKFKSAMSSMADGAEKLAKGVIVAQAAVTAFMGHFIGVTDEAAKFARQFDINFETLQELEYAMDRVGGSSSELRGDIAKLTKEFGHMGSADEMLEGLAEQFKGFDAIQQLQFGERLGLSQGTIRLLAQGRFSIAELRQEARDLGVVLDEETAKNAEKAADALTNLKAVIIGNANAIAADFLPEMTEATKSIVEFLKANKDAIKSTIKRFITGVSDGFKLFGEVLKPIVDLLPDFKGEMIKTRLIALAVASAMSVLAVRTLLAVLPFALVTLGAAALIIILEDVWKTISGEGKTVMGDFNNYLKREWPKTWEAIGKGVAFLVEKLETLFNIIARGKKKIRVEAEYSALEEFVDKPLRAGGLKKSITKEERGKKIDEYLDTVLRTQGRLAYIVALLDPTTGNRYGDVKPLLEGAEATNAAQSNGSVNRSNIPANVVKSFDNTQSDNRQLTVNVNGSNSPQATGRAVIEQSGFGRTMQGVAPMGAG